MIWASLNSGPVKLTVCQLSPVSEYQRVSTATDWGFIVSKATIP